MEEEVYMLKKRRILPSLIIAIILILSSSTSAFAVFSYEPKFNNTITANSVASISDGGYIVQDFALIEEDTSMQNILVPTLYSKHKKSSKEYREIINGMAEKLQIADKLKSTVKHLSGGERQRVAIIRSMVNDQKIILTDEPTGSLDKDNSAIVIHCLRELAHDLQRAVVIVTHDPDVARQCDRTFLLADGSLTPCAL